jgi:hypothetical protein
MALEQFKAKDIYIELQESKLTLFRKERRADLESTNRPRMLRLISPVDTTIHDLLLIDSPKFHFVLDFARNVEVYHLTIRGANLGSFDGIDAIGTNYYIHDNEVNPVFFKYARQTFS